MRQQDQERSRHLHRSRLLLDRHRMFKDKGEMEATVVVVVEKEILVMRGEIGREQLILLGRRRRLRRRPRMGHHSHQGMVAVKKAPYFPPLLYRRAPMCTRPRCLR